MAGQMNDGMEKNTPTAEAAGAQRAIHPPWFGYPLPGCSPAEPGAVSPNGIERSGLVAGDQDGTHGITNATSESINAKIQWVKYTARGFRNVENFKNAIYFHCGDLNLTP
jgi:hypothetical protein